MFNHTERSAVDRSSIIGDLLVPSRDCVVAEEDSAMPWGSPVDGFRLAYDHRRGSGTSVVLLRGWPGDRADWRAVLPRLPKELEVVAPDLRGFGDSDKHRREAD
jgi:pimeloyl-ACP methyl ester carboxylesterase